MTVLEIPIVSSAAHFVQEHEIFQKCFFLEFEWLECEGSWLLHIFGPQRKSLAMGIKLIDKWPLYSHHENKKTFTFMLLAKSPGQELTRYNLSQTFSLVAYEAV